VQRLERELKAQTEARLTRSRAEGEAAIAALHAEIQQLRDECDAERRSAEEELSAAKVGEAMIYG
jgi:hypothetical protein